MSKRLTTCEMWVYYEPTKRVRRCRAEPVGGFIVSMGAGPYKFCEKHGKGHGRIRK